jgi:hypothetical protein
MATAVRVPQGESQVPQGEHLIGYEEALQQLSGDEMFRAMLSAMNTLLIGKGLYTAEEFRFQIRQVAQKRLAQKRAA